MYKKIYKSALLLSLMAFASVSYSANTIQLNGSIVEDTCSQQHQNNDCQQLNVIRDKIDTQSISINDLNIQTQKNTTTDISFEQLSDQKSAVIIANYY
ncbi:type 1 fimbrial protein [Acinetobacter sp. ANC 3882]|uniref:type 1 fimbrial protein n=1 Tax=Acinetobacter sp. ANC 3882 TaxID=2923423 RepID=UPI001F4B9288|nr:type 1 fimbrial protein [Acinetobacter sp. ANC 3882]MCH7313402.1 type 1 fimbrial protein [Acinetobacter sp. ANC 3882]